MKRLIVLGIILLVASCRLSQKNKLQEPPSQLPSFNVLLLDSTTLLNASQLPIGNSTLMIYFQPDCEHCNEGVQKLVQHMESLKDVNILLISSFPITELKQFCERYKLNKFKNITVGRDYKYSFYNQYTPAVVPFTAIYDRNNKLVKIYSGDIIINAILDAVRA